MAPVFKKLNLKQKEAFVLNAPAEFEKALLAIQPDTLVKKNVRGNDNIKFVLTFVNSKAEIDQITSIIIKKLESDAVVWFAYPKGTSKKYKAEINRDRGWEILGKSGFEAVRQVSIDDDWSAVRFRKVEFIKTMSRRRDFAMTEHGKQKSQQTAQDEKS